MPYGPPGDVEKAFEVMEKAAKGGEVVAKGARKAAEASVKGGKAVAKGIAELVAHFFGPR